MWVIPTVALSLDTKPELDDVTSVITVIVVVIGACLIVLAAAIYLMWQRKGELEDLCLIKVHGT